MADLEGEKGISGQPGGEIILYALGDGSPSLRVRLDGEKVWLTQAQMAGLFQTTSQNITQHLKAIVAERELDEAATCKGYLQVRDEGKRQVTRNLRHYSLEAVIAVGYRVRQQRKSSSSATMPASPSRALPSFSSKQPTKAESAIAKNYLNADELRGRAEHEPPARRPDIAETADPTRRTSSTSPATGDRCIGPITRWTTAAPPLISPA